MGWVAVASRVLLACALAATSATLAEPSTLRGASASVDVVDGAQVSGTVYSSSGSPLAGVTVRMQGVHSVVTDAQGSYVLADVPSGDRRLAFDGSATGHDVRRLDGSPFFLGLNDYASDTNVSIAPHEVLEGVDAVLQPVGSITGRLTRGPDLRTRTVEAYWRADERSTWEPVADTRLADDGTFALRALPAGDYKVGFRWGAREDSRAGAPAYVYGGNTSTLESSPVLSVRAGGTVSGVDATERLDGRIEGVASGPDGPVAASIYLERWDDRQSTWIDVGGTTAGPDGTYSIDELPQGIYTLHARRDYPSIEIEPKVVTLDPGSRLRMDLALRRTSQVSGVVRSAITGAPIEGVRISSYAYFGDGIWYDTLHGTRTDEQGRYVVVQTRSRLRFAAPGYAPQFNGGAFSLGTAPVMEPAPFQDLVEDVVLTAGATLTGTVSDSATGEPAGDESVMAMRLTDGAWVDTEGARTQADGSYTIEHLAPGTYVLRVGSETHGLRYGNDVAALSAAAQVEVPESGVVHRDASVSRTGKGTISGQIHAVRPPTTEECECPFERDIKVSLYQRSGGEWHRVRSVWSDPGDTFELRDVPAGTYRVGFAQAHDYYSPEFWEDADTVDDARDVVVRAGETTSGIDPDLDVNPIDPIRNLTPPVVSGPRQVGETLTVSPGVWNRDDLTFTYGWLSTVDDKYLPGETGATLRLTEERRGRSFVAVVTASGPGRPPRVVWSEITGAVGGAPRASYTSPRAPTIEGRAQVGSILRATTGTWTPSGARFGYQWYAGDDPVSGANDPTFALSAAQEGEQISVRILAWGDAGAPTTMTTTQTGSVLPAPATTPTPPPPSVGPSTVPLTSTRRPVVSGKPRVGRMLRVRGARWSREDIVVTYRWFAGGRRIRSAHRATLRLGARLSGKRIVAQVTAHATGEGRVTVRTRPTPRVRR